MRMSKSLLVPIDGSEYAKKALQYAMQMAQGMDAEIILMNVQPSYNTANVRRFFKEEDIREYQEELAKEVLTPAVKMMEDSAMSYDTVTRIGVPGVVICNEAKERGVEGIVMGSRGLGPIRGAILGSVSYSVLHNAPCPVTIV